MILFAPAKGFFTPFRCQIAAFAPGSPWICHSRCEMITFAPAKGRMKVTKEYIEQRFLEFNDLMFQGALPLPTIVLSNVKSYVGACTYRKRRKLFGGTEFYDFKLRFNTRVDLPREELDDTIIHEMIHYSILLGKRRDASAHGPLFREMMNKINHDYNRHITISHKGSRDELLETKRKMRNIAVVRFKDGKVGIKVLPQNPTSVMSYYRKASSSTEVQSVIIYRSDNQFFSKFPCSSALRVHYQPEEIIIEQLADASIVR